MNPEDIELIGGVVIYILLLIIVTRIGKKRRIGAGLAFLLSLIFSPVIGFIITILSPRKDDENLVRINHDSNQSSKSIADELKKYHELKDAGTISEEEFAEIKSNLLNKELT